MKKFLFVSLIVGILCLNPLLSSISLAQCALCQSQVQTSTNEGNHQAAGLNSGILYLMSTPYLIAVGIGIVWFKKYRKKDILLEMKDEPLNLN